MEKNKIALVNFFSRGRENYAQGTNRMLQTFYGSGIEGVDAFVFSPDYNDHDNTEEVFNNGRSLGYVHFNKGMPITEALGECKPHVEAPYQFKAFVIQHAREKGYEKVIWLDSSIVTFKNPLPHILLSEEIGVVLYDNPGCLESTWTSDDCLEIIGCSIDVARTFFQIDAAMMIFDFTTKKANEVFDDYLQYALNPIALKGEGKSNREDFKAHRHDQSIMSYIARINHYINPLNYGAWSYFKEAVENVHPPTFGKVGIGATIEFINASIAQKRYTGG